MAVMWFISSSGRDLRVFFDILIMDHGIMELQKEAAYLAYTFISTEIT
jgi:hypothetical protein